MKLKSNKGNVFTIVLVVLALFTIFVGIIFMQINNQIKSNKNTVESMNAKYVSEAGIEDVSLKVINQIESKVNLSTLVKSSSVQNKSTYDEFAAVKNQLIKVYEKLSDLDNKYNIFDSSEKKLYDVIYNDYTSTDILKDDINEVKWDIIQVLAYKNDSVKNEIKSTIYSIIDDINIAQISLYGSSHMHEGENHKALDIKIIVQDPWNTYVDSDYINKNFIGSNNAPYDYKLESIRGYTTNVLRPAISELKNNINSYKPEELQNKLIDVDNKVIHSIENVLISINNSFNELRYLRNDNCNDDNINKVKNKLCSEIDNLIKNGIKDVENALYSLYIEQFNKYGELNIENLESLKEISSNIETIKINLMELKCKLGFASSNTDGEITPPDVDTSVPSEIYIEVDEFEVLLDDNYSYQVDKIDKTPINVTYNFDKISRVDSVELELISTGNVHGKTYTRKAVVEFTTTKQGDGFITDYSIKSYEKQ